MIVFKRDSGSKVLFKERRANNKREASWKKGCFPFWDDTATDCLEDGM